MENFNIEDPWRRRFLETLFESAGEAQVAHPQDGMENEACYHLEQLNSFAIKSNPLNKI